MLYLIKTLFISKLSYASHIWITKNNMKDINKLWYHILKSITGAVLNISQNVAEVILGVPPIFIQTTINCIKHFLKLNINPAVEDRYRDFLESTYNEVTKSPATIHNKFKDTFNFLKWKMKLYPSHFNIEDNAIVSGKQFKHFFNLSEKACSYSKVIINKYAETMWKSMLKNQFQIDGYPISPNPSCESLPIPPNTSRETEILVMSMMYKNNLLNASLYKLGKVPSPLCSFCGQQEETADHILFECTSVDEDLRANSLNTYRLATNSSEGEAAADSYIGIINASRNQQFISSCIDILSSLNLKVTVDL